MINERLRSFPFIIYYRKYSCFIEPFNEKIAQFAANGLLKRNKAKYVNLKLIKLKYLEMKFVKRRPLTFFDIKGTLIICGGLHLVSLIIFLLECFVVKYSRKSFKNRVANDS